MRIRLLPILLAGAVALATQLSWCQAAAAQNPGLPHRPGHPLGPGGFPGHVHPGRGHSRSAALAARDLHRVLRGVPRERRAAAGNRGHRLARLHRPEVRGPTHRRGDCDYDAGPGLRTRASAGPVSRRAHRVRRRPRAGRGRQSPDPGRHRRAQRRRLRRHAGARAEAAPVRAQGARRGAGAERRRLRGARAGRARTVLTARGAHLRPAAVPSRPAGRRQGRAIGQPDFLHAIRPGRRRQHHALRRGVAPHGGGVPGPDLWDDRCSTWARAPSAA